MEDLMLIIVVVAIGAVIGWLGSLLMRGAGYGLQGDVIAGVIGAIIGNYLLPKLGLFLGGGYIAESINAAIGAIIAVAVVKLIKRA